MTTSDPTPSDHDQLLAEADKYGPESMSSALIRKLTVALRAEQIRKEGQ